MTGVLDDRSKRLDGIQHSIDGMQRRIGALEHAVDASRSSLEERLDRLLTITVEERTVHYERLRELERRVARLEERIGK